MYRLEYEAPSISGEILYHDGDNGKSVTEDWFGAFFRALVALHNVVPLAEFVFARQPAGHFKHEITTADGRMWKQQIRFDALRPLDPWQTFDVTQEWRRSEFLANIPPREELILIHARADIEKGEITF